MSAVDASGCVLVPLERLRALEALEATIAERKTAEEHDADRFKMLRERDKANPELASKRALKYYDAHKEEINARRREKRRLAKESKTPE
jgi:hypothetical protein